MGIPSQIDFMNALIGADKTDVGSVGDVDSGDNNDEDCGEELAPLRSVEQQPLSISRQSCELLADCLRDFVPEVVSLKECSPFVLVTTLLLSVSRHTIVDDRPLITNPSAS